MKPDICPAITAHTPNEFREQFIRVMPFAKRVHLDVSDGSLTPEKLMDISDLWWPANIRADIHVMFEQPFDHTALLLNLQPQLIIVHAEGKGDFVEFAQKAHAHSVEVGVALQQHTPAEIIKSALQFIDHVLIFSGKLGYFGGAADLSLLAKVTQLKQWKPQLEIGWDGGVNPENAAALVAGGAQVLNSGGFIQRAQNPADAYRQLMLAAATKRA